MVNNFEKGFNTISCYLIFCFFPATKQKNGFKYQMSPNLTATVTGHGKLQSYF